MNQPDLFGGEARGIKFVVSGGVCDFDGDRIHNMLHTNNISA